MWNKNENALSAPYLRKELGKGIMSISGLLFVNLTNSNSDLIYLPD